MPWVSGNDQVILIEKCPDQNRTEMTPQIECIVTELDTDMTQMIKTEKV